MRVSLKSSCKMGRLMDMRFDCAVTAPAFGVIRSVAERPGTYPA
jgi:hypothetical protein